MMPTNFVRFFTDLTKLVICETYLGALNLKGIHTSRTFFVMFFTSDPWSAVYFMRTSFDFESVPMIQMDCNLQE